MGWAEKSTGELWSPCQADRDGSISKADRVAHGVEGQLGGGEKVTSAIKGESDVRRGEDREEVILSSPNRSFRFVGAMIVWRDTLKVDAGLGGLEEGSELRRDFVIDLNVG
jgi:hypothetical protein